MGLLKRVQDTTGFDAVAIRKVSRADGHLCRSSKSSDNSFRVLSFECILDALEFIKRDKYFTVGTTVVKRLGGWPMGGSFSEPGTLVDLNEELHVLHQSPERLKSVGWAFKGWRLEELVSGVMHVDDAVVFSRIFCNQCLETGVRHVWPQDVGVSLEEVGPTVRMLQSHIHVKEGRFHVRPFNPNVAFALGFTSQQKVARLGPYLGARIHSYNTLRSFVHGKILAYDHLVLGEACNMYIHIGFLLLEVARLGWSETFMSKALCSLSRRHGSPFIAACRKVGKELRRCSLLSLFDPNELVGFLSSCPIEAAVHGDMSSKPWRPGGGHQGWRPWSRPAYQQTDSHGVSREVVEFVREEKKRREEERHAEEVQQKAKETVMSMFGMPKYSGATSSPASGSSAKSKPFETLSWIAQKLMNKGTAGSESSEKKRKSKKKRKEKASSDSTSSDSDSWVEAKKACEKGRKKDRKDKKEKKQKGEDRKEKKKRKASQPRQLKAMSSSPKVPEEKGLPKTRREELAKTLKVEGKITMDQLESDDWMVDLAHVVKKEDLQRLAERNNVGKSGNKHDILKRLVTYMQGEWVSTFLPQV